MHVHYFINVYMASRPFDLTNTTLMNLTLLYMTFDKFDLTLHDFDEFDLSLHNFNEFDLTLHDL